jgi:hypothetical protein
MEHVVLSKVWIPKPTHKDPHAGEFALKIDRNKVEGSRVLDHGPAIVPDLDDSPRQSIDLRLESAVDLVCAISAEIVGKFASRVYLWCRSREHEWMEWASISIDKDAAAVRIGLALPLRTWARPFSVEDLIAEININCGVGAGLGIAKLDGNNCRFQRDWSPVRDLTIGDIYHSTAREGAEAIEQALVNLDQRHRSESLITTFDFPAPYRSACEQYLMYFAQFLRDLGMEANVEVREDAHRSLFSVTPLDQTIALANVRDALDAFLTLPTSPIEFEALSRNSDPAAQQLAIN